MVSIGNTILPGTQTDVESANSIGVNVGAPGQIGLVGEADLENGTATPNELEIIRTPVAARTKFGDGSQLAENVVGALTEGAFPVYAVATEEVSETGEDISGLSGTSGTLANAPVTEQVEDEVTFTVDSTDLTVARTYEDPSTQTVAAGEVHYNPVTGVFELGEAPSTSGTADYVHFDYDSAVDEMFDKMADLVDVIGLVSENASAFSYAHTKAQNAVNRYNLLAVVNGAAARIADTFTYENTYDSSRAQQIYPSRDADDLSIIGNYVGLLASLGINQSAMMKRLSVSDLAVTLSPDDQANLLDQTVVPIADESAGARVVEDVTTVTETNTEEASMRSILHRLIVDYVTNIVNSNAERYIGNLHKKSTRDALEASISAELKRLIETDSLTAFNLNVQEVDAMTASVDVGIDTVDPLRNIVATVSAGQIESGA